MKLQIDIPEDSLLFIDVPEIYENLVIKNYGYAGAWIMETDSDEFNHWKLSLPTGDYTIIGFVKDVVVDKDFIAEGNFILRKL